MTAPTSYRAIYGRQTDPDGSRWAIAPGRPRVPFTPAVEPPPDTTAVDVVSRLRGRGGDVIVGSPTGRDAVVFSTATTLLFPSDWSSYGGIIPGSTLTRTPGSGEGDYTVPSNAANSVPTTINGVSTGSTGAGTPVENREFFGIPRLGTLANVWFKNCRFWGTVTPRVQTGCVEASSLNHRGAWYTDCEFKVRNNNTWHTGIRGSDYRVWRSEFTGAADALTLNGTGGDVQAWGNWLHDGAYDEWSAGDTNYLSQGDNYLHCDGVQFHQGANYDLRYNYIGGARTGRWSHHAGQKASILADDDFYLSGILMAQAPAQSDGVQYRITGTAAGNVIEGSSVAINVATSNGYDLAGFTFRDNIIVRNSFSLAYIKKPVGCNAVFINNRHPDGALVTIVG